MKQIWHNDAAEFHGEMVNFDPIWCWPKPAQAGGPPVWMGSLSMKSLERVVDYCDGWFPVDAPVEALTQRLELLRQAAARAGRNFASIALGAVVFGATDDKCRRLIDLGFTHLVLGQPSFDEPKALHRLDQTAELVVKLR
jgi:alkanesulfonate monooxygenase SsuD/methylene tetrahydromethanopterin reductase-like flavin-dependent oxidoreductase (luciferase family)